MSDIRHQEIIDRLDRIISLLEFRESINNPQYVVQDLKDHSDIQINPAEFCNCKSKGQTSAVITCPVHG